MSKRTEYCKLVEACNLLEKVAVSADLAAEECADAVEDLRRHNLGATFEELQNAAVELETTADKLWALVDELDRQIQTLEVRND